MTETDIMHMHEDLEILKKDVAEIKAALLNEEGELSGWVKERLELYVKEPRDRFISQEYIEKEFL